MTGPVSSGDFTLTPPQRKQAFKWLKFYLILIQFLTVYDTFIFHAICPISPGWSLHGVTVFLIFCQMRKHWTFYCDTFTNFPEFKDFLNVKIYTFLLHFTIKTTRKYWPKLYWQIKCSYRQINVNTRVLSLKNCFCCLCVCVCVCVGRGDLRYFFRHLSVTTLIGLKCP